MYANPAFERVTGYARAELLGPEPARPQERVARRGLLRPACGRRCWPADTWRGLLVNRRKDGSRVRGGGDDLAGARRRRPDDGLRRREARPDRRASPRGGASRRARRAGRRPRRRSPRSAVGATPEETADVDRRGPAQRRRHRVPVRLPPLGPRPQASSASPGRDPGVATSSRARTSIATNGRRTSATARPTGPGSTSSRTSRRRARPRSRSSARPASTGRDLRPGRRRRPARSPWSAA